jgi:hypothetical protein
MNAGGGADCGQGEAARLSPSDGASVWFLK